MKFKDLEKMIETYEALKCTPDFVIKVINMILDNARKPLRKKNIIK